MAGWTLEVDWLGRTWEWTDQQLTVTESAELFDDSLNVRTASFAVIFPGISVAAKYARGYRLDGATARIKLDGITHLAGRVEGPQFGGPGVPARFSVREVPWDDRGIFPSVWSHLQAVIDEDATAAAIEAGQEKLDAINSALQGLGHPGVTGETWTDVTVWSERAVGLTYPYAFGKSGITSADGSGGLGVDLFPVLEVPLVDKTANDEIVVIAGHGLNVPTNSLCAMVSDTGTGLGTMVNKTYSMQQDATGRNCTVVDLGADTSLLGSPATEYDRPMYVSFIHGSTPGGAGDVIETVLRHSTLRIDWQRQRGYRDALNRYQLQGVVDDQAKPWDWIRSNILALLPVTPVISRTGLAIVPFLPEAPSVASLVDGPECSVVPALRASDRAPVNEVTILYAPDAYRRVHAKAVVIGPGQSAYAAMSQQLFGRGAVEIKTNIVYSDTDAAAIATDIIRAKSFPPLLAEAYLQRSRWGYLRVGDVVEIDCSNLSFSGRRCMIASMSRDGGPRIHADLMVLVDPLVDAFDADAT